MHACVHAAHLGDSFPRHNGLVKEDATEVISVYTYQHTHIHKPTGRTYGGQSLIAKAVCVYG